MKDIYIINGFILDYRGLQRGKCIKIENDKITYVGDNPKVIPTNAIIIDAKNKCVMPGIVNCHTHFYSAFSNAVVCKENNFQKILEKLWWCFDNILSKEDIYLSALVSAVDAIKAGVTCVFDHHASYSAIDGSLSVIAKAVSEVFIRASVCYEISDRHGKKKAEKAVQENADILSFCSGDCRIFSSLIGLHASFTLSNDTLKLISSLVKQYNCGVHTHLLEDKIDRKITREKYGKTPVERFEKYKLLNDKSVYAHGVDLNALEIKILAKNKCFVVHNPFSNLGNAVGKMPLFEMSAKGLKMGVGTDGFGNDPCLDSRLSSVVHNDNATKGPSGFDVSYEALLKNNTEFASRHFGIKIGRIEKGYSADVVIRDYVPTDNSFNKSELFYKMLSSSAETVIVNGRIVRAYNKMLTINEEELFLYVRNSIKNMRKKWSKNNGGVL